MVSTLERQYRGTLLGMAWSVYFGGVLLMQAIGWRRGGWLAFAAGSAVTAVIMWRLCLAVALEARARRALAIAAENEAGGFRRRW